MEAEKKLLLPQNEHGSYLIRDSESRHNDYSLSVRDGDTVKHYRIRQLDEGGFFIARKTTFRTLQELVEHYSRDADGLCVNLRKPCIQVTIRNNVLTPLLALTVELFTVYKDVDIAASTISKSLCARASAGHIPAHPSRPLGQRRLASSGW